MRLLKRGYQNSNFLDYSRTFETVDKDILLKKLACCGIRDNVHKWFHSYLKNRKQNVKLGNHVFQAIKTGTGTCTG